MHALSTENPWPNYQRILFRFLFVFFLLFILFFNNGTFFFWRPFEILLKVGFSDIISWAGRHLLGLGEVNYGKANGSGDTSFNYVLLFCIFVVSAVSAAVWSVLDRKARNYQRLLYWLTAGLRYYVGLMLVQYGLAKVIDGQFPTPDVVRLSRTFGESTPMGLAWTFFGYSDGYKWFMAAAEFMAVLLLFRRTMTVGAIIALGTCANIMAVNYFFDVPVKIISTALVAMSLFLLLVQSRQLFAFFFLGKASPLPALYHPFRKNWQFYTRTGVKSLLLLITVTFAVYSLFRMKDHFKRPVPETPVAGLHRVVEFKVDGKAEEGNRWTELRLVNNTATVYYSNGATVSSVYYVYPEKNRLELFLNPLATEPETYTYRTERDGLMVLVGRHQQKPVQIRLRKAGGEEFLLMKTGFHWISERPDNQ